MTKLHTTTVPGHVQPQVQHQQQIQNVQNVHAVQARPAPRKYKKPRKPYVITKPRENWTPREHQMFLDALKVYERDWKMINQIIKTKSVIQIRSHAQKYFLKMMKAGRLDEIPPPRPKKRIPSAADKNNTTTKSTAKRGGRASKHPTAASINTHLDTYQLHTHLSSHSTNHESMDLAGNPLAALSMYMPEQQQSFNSFMIQQQYSTPPMTATIPPPINTSFNFPQPTQFVGHTRSLSQTLPSPMSLMASPVPLTPVFPQVVVQQEMPEQQTSLTILDGLSQKTAVVSEQTETASKPLRTMASFIPSDSDSSDDDSSDEEMSGMNPDYLSLVSPDSPLGSRHAQQHKDDAIAMVEGSAADSKSPFSVHAFQQLELSKMSHDDKTLLNSLVGNLADNLEDYISTLNNNNVEHAFITTDASKEICV